MRESCLQYFFNVQERHCADKLKKVNIVMFLRGLFKELDFVCEHIRLIFKREMTTRRINAHTYCRRFGRYEKDS